jgi:hypothetical protein
MTSSNSPPLQHIRKLQLTTPLWAGKANAGPPGAAAHLPWRSPILYVLLVLTGILSTGADSRAPQLALLPCSPWLHAEPLSQAASSLFAARSGVLPARAQLQFCCRAHCLFSLLARLAVEPHHCSSSSDFPPCLPLCSPFLLKRKLSRVPLSRA